MTIRLPRSRVPLAVAIVATALGCGDPIVPGSYRGEPLHVIRGWVQLTVSPEALLGSAEDPDELRVAVLWSQTKGSSFELDGAVEQEVVTTGTFPARFTITLYEPPAADVLRAVPDAATGGAGTMAIAAVVAYVDGDRDETWDRGEEPLVGGADERLFLYTPDGVTSAVLGTWGPGFHTLVPTRACDTALGGGGVRYELDASATIDLKVDGTFPTSALFDVDCDPTTFDWGGTCPPLERVREDCRTGDALDAGDEAMCLACESRLWSEEAEGDPDACYAWFVSCLYDAPPWECEREYYTCVGRPPPPPDRHCDLRCVCDKVYEECREDGESLSECDTRRHDCFEH
ncbi:MAG: hypothetical protein IT385_15935 [Deltaproteobacteria bacterium]|nr:hypothetical protein [Deltaproteobacteria bacterium]